MIHQVTPQARLTLHTHPSPPRVVDSGASHGRVRLGQRHPPSDSHTGKLAQSPRHTHTSLHPQIPSIQGVAHKTMFSKTTSRGMGRLGERRSELGIGSGVLNPIVHSPIVLQSCSNTRASRTSCVALGRFRELGATSG